MDYLSIPIVLISSQPRCLRSQDLHSLMFTFRSQFVVSKLQIVFFLSLCFPRAIVCSLNSLSPPTGPVVLFDLSFLSKQFVL